MVRITDREEDHPLWEKTKIHQTDSLFGFPIGKVKLTHHAKDQCSGQYCSIHNPSPHHMVTWHQLWRGDRGIMERICPHGIGHPDPDDVAHHERIKPDDDYYGVHGCDGCCAPPGTLVGGAPILSDENTGDQA
jgi:hypothetical protein